MNKEFDAIVIGAGNAGLAAAAGLQRQGVNTLLLERHNIPGGCATSFVRGDFEFEVALHQLSGVGTEEAPFMLRQTFDQLGIMDKIELVEEGELYRFCVPGEIDITLPADMKGIAAELARHFPSEQNAISAYLDLCATIALEYYMIYPQKARLNDPDELKSSCPNLVEYGVRSTKDVLDCFFQDERLKAVLGGYWGYIGLPLDKLPFVELGGMFYLYAEHKPYHVVGGSQAISNALLESFLEAGGEVQFNTAAETIHTEDDQVVGVTTEHGDRLDCKHVVSNASAIHTFNHLLDIESLPDSVAESFKHNRVGVSGFIVYMGLNCTPEDLGITAASNFINSVLDASSIYDSCNRLEPPTGCLLTCYNYDDPKAAPEGKSVIGLMCVQYGAPWEDLSEEKYFETKYAYADQLIALAEQTYPGIKAHIEEVEVATPLTVMRYLNTPGGAIYGFDQNALQTAVFRTRYDQIGGLHLAGAWSGAGGFQPTYQSGQAAANRVRRKLVMN